MFVASVWSSSCPLPLSPLSRPLPMLPRRFLALAMGKLGDEGALCVRPWLSCVLSLDSGLVPEN